MSYNALVRNNNEIRNHEGAKAWLQTPEFELYSAVVCTLSMDDKFYESGNTRADRIARLVRMVDARFVAQLAIYARTEMHLRSVPMLLLVELAKCHSGDSLVSRATAMTIQRVDDITELLACYQWRQRRKNLKHLSSQLRKGIAESFNKFDEYQFAKYNRTDKQVTLRDALFLTHPKAKDAAQQQLFDKIAKDALEIPYTWETELSKSAGKDKCETWTELIQSRRMGYMAMLRNLRNFLKAGVDKSTMQMVYDYLSDKDAVNKSKQLPFRFFAAYLMMTGHISPVRTKYYDQMSDVLNRSNMIYSSIHQLENRQYLVRRRKVKRESTRRYREELLLLSQRNSQPLMRLFTDLGYPNPNTNAKPISRYHIATTQRFAVIDRVSNHLGKYLSHLRRRIESLGDIYSQLYDKNRQLITNNQRPATPFYAPKETLECLEKAARHSASSIPSFDDDTRVCIACDTSGSMMSYVSDGSVMQCYDLALFFGAMMKYRCPDAVVGMFGDIWMPVDMPADDIMRNTLKMRKRAGEAGYATNGHKVIEWLCDTNKVMDKVMIFTDCQFWNISWCSRKLADVWRRYKRTVAPDARLYLFDLAGYGQNPIDVDNEKDVYCIAGWSDKVFDMLAALENGKSVIDEIRRIAV